MIKQVSNTQGYHSRGQCIDVTDISVRKSGDLGAILADDFSPWPKNCCCNINNAQWKGKTL